MGWKDRDGTQWCYLLTQSVRNWVGAGESCSNVGGELVSVVNATEQSFIQGKYILLCIPHVYA